MSELGQLLKNARVEKGISLDEMQDITKIRKRYLEAIEDQNLTVLPGNFYVRAFIKSYAETVGLDPDEVIDMYKSVIPAPETSQPSETITKTRRETRSNDRAKWTSRVLMWSFAFLILGIIYYFLVNYNDSASNSQKASNDKLQIVGQTNTQNTPQANGEGAQKQDQAKEQNVQQTPAPSKAEENAAKPEETPAATEITLVPSSNGAEVYEMKTGELQIELKVIGNASWVEAYNHDRKGTHLTNASGEADGAGKQMVQGETRVWKTSNPVWLRLGAANQVEVKINGVLLNTGTVATVKNFQIIPKP